MLHLKAISEKDASGNVKRLYQDIRLTLQTKAVPTIFQYLANYELYFTYAWGLIKEVESTSSFRASSEQIIQLSDAMMSVVYASSPEMSEFVTGLNPGQKKDLHDSIHVIHILNAKLTLVAIGVRESIKGVPVGVKKLSAETASEVFQEDAMKSFVNEVIDFTQSNEMTIASNLLVPMVGSTLPVLSDYPSFFAYAARDFATLMKTEAYLRARVELERLGHTLISNFTTSFQFSYTDTEKYLRNQPYLDELVFLLKDTFPSQYPRFVMTSSAMLKSLSS